MFLLKLRMLRLYGIYLLWDWYRDVWKTDPYEQVCCSGYQCGCYGELKYEMWEYLIRQEKQ